MPGAALNQKAAITLGVVRWADQIKKKNIPGLDADFTWKLNDIPDDFREPFQEIAGISTSGADTKWNPAMVFHHGAGVLLGVDLNRIAALNQIGKILDQTASRLMFSLLPRGSAMDSYDLKMVASPDAGIKRSALFTGIEKSLDTFTFSGLQIEVKVTKGGLGSPAKVLGSVKSWFNFKLNAGINQMLQAYTVITVPMTASLDDKGIEFAGFLEGTIIHPYGLLDKDFPSLRLVNPQLGGKLGTSGWLVWLGGKPLFNGEPVRKITFVRGGVTPDPPFISFVDIEMEEQTLSKLAGPLADGAITGIGKETKFAPFPTDLLKLGGFTWQDDIKTDGPRLIYSKVNLDTIGITKGVTAMGSLNYDADGAKKLELGKFEFVYQSAGTIAGQGKTKSFQVGPLAFTGQNTSDPVLDVYLSNNPAALNNHILFRGALVYRFIEKGTYY